MIGGGTLRLKFNIGFAIRKIIILFQQFVKIEF